MSNPAWKKFERDVAALLGGKRFWANSGERLDVESDTAIAQCKLVKQMSLAELTALAEEVEREAAPKFKAGVVAVKLRRGRGRSSPMLLVVTEATWRRMNGGADDCARGMVGGESPSQGREPSAMSAATPG